MKLPLTVAFIFALDGGLQAVITETCIDCFKTVSILWHFADWMVSLWKGSSYSESKLVLVCAMLMFVVCVIDDNSALNMIILFCIEYK